MENSEKAVTSAEQKFHKQLLEKGLAEEIIPGREISIDSFEIAENVDFAVETFVQAAVRYLSAPTIKDSFTSHEEDRIPAYNHSGLLTEENSELYLNNRLRVNKIFGAIGGIKSIASRKKRLSEALTQKAEEILSEFDLESYKNFENSEKLNFTEKLAAELEDLLAEVESQGLVTRK